jgi:hypothetical protein
LSGPEPTYSLTAQKTCEGYVVKAHPSGNGGVLRRVFPTWEEFESSAAPLLPQQDSQKLYAELNSASLGVQFPSQELVTLSVAQALGLK